MAHNRRIGWILAASIVTALIHAKIVSRALADEQADASAVKGAVVLVIAKGFLPQQGNAPVSEQGTGFFISKEGFLVTSYHLVGDLGGVDPASVSYEVHFGALPNDPVAPAQQVQTDPFNDVMVLFAPVGDRDVPILKPADPASEHVTAGTTVYTVGYPAGYSYSVDQGIIKSLAGIISPPKPVWSTNLALKQGQSGSPILLADNKVIAIAKGADAQQSSIGLVVPIKLVPTNFWDGSLVESAAEPLVTGQPVARIVVQATVSSGPVQKVQEFTLQNEPCQSPQQRTFAVTATEGTEINPNSIKIGILSLIGSADYIIQNRTATAFTIAAMLTNAGVCQRVSNGVAGTILARDEPAKLVGHVSYEEIPTTRTPQVVTTSNTAAIGNIKIPLPQNIPANALSFKATSPSGETRTFQPAVDELSNVGGVRVLDTAKVINRLFQ